MIDVYHKVIITGAGFSVPWGGPTAAELRQWLFNNCPTGYDAIRSCLLRFPDYESALNDLESEQNFAARVLTKRFRSMVAEFFLGMDQRVQTDRHHRWNAEGRFLQAMSCLIENASGKAVVWATLNQDLVMERIWTKKEDRYGIRGKKRGAIYDPFIVGQGRLSEYWLSANDHLLPSVAVDAGESPSNTELQPGLNYLKLHGSANWRFNGEPMMVTGGLKGAFIERQPLLRRLDELFDYTLKNAQVDLLLIGLSLNDWHIRKKVVEAAKLNGLKITIWDPNAMEIASVLTKEGISARNVRLIQASVQLALDGEKLDGPIKGKQWLESALEFFGGNVLSSWS